MKAAYDYWATQANEMRAGIDFDPDCVTADDLQMMRTREAVLGKLEVIFNGSSQSSSEKLQKSKITSIGQRMSERKCNIG